jgi:2,5-dioxopentanoate dehydrogenase
VSLAGAHFVGGQAVAGRGEGFCAREPRAGVDLTPVYRDAEGELIAAACTSAAAVAGAFAATDPSRRAALLRSIGEGLVALGPELVDRVVAETALPAPRVENERARTVLQLEQFAALVEDGSWVEAMIARGDAARRPQPRPDLRRMLVPLGPVAVFGASNFPLAYSVAGGDTASAFAAGCPVVVKGHPAHPGTSELVGAVIVAALVRHGLPAGAFALLHGRGHEVGSALVRHPAIAAVGFTGSHAGGRALFDLAAARRRPIPVFAEMGSMNPVVVLPRALAARAAAVADRLADSALLAQGQFCTSPGLVLTIAGPGADALRARLRERLALATGGPVVHPSIRQGFERALEEVQALPVEVAARGRAGDGGDTSVCPVLLQATSDAVVNNARLRSEIYGPAILLVVADDAAALRSVVRSLDGHLTATVHGDGGDFAQHADVVDELRRRVGRLIANGVPTGVEVSPAMVHGGPYPAATDPRYSAVGTTAIRRWVRPACWQDWPHELLPPELRDDNPRGIERQES